MIWIAFILLAGSLPFLVRSSYEMFVLTPQYGPQMIFYSLFHTWPHYAVMAFIYSWYVYYGLAAFLLLFAASRLLLGGRRARLWASGDTQVEGGSSRSRALRVLVRWLAGRAGVRWSVLVYVSTVLVLLHFVAAMTYDRWSGALFSARG